MKLSRIVYKINKIMLNVIKFNVTSFFHNGAKTFYKSPKKHGYNRVKKNLI